MKTRRGDCSCACPGAAPRRTRSPGLSSTSASRVCRHRRRPCSSTSTSYSSGAASQNLPSSLPHPPPRSPAFPAAARRRTHSLVSSCRIAQEERTHRRRPCSSTSRSCSKLASRNLQCSPPRRGGCRATRDGPTRGTDEASRRGSGGWGKKSEGNTCTAAVLLRRSLQVRMKWFQTLYLFSLIEG